MATWYCEILVRYFWLIPSEIFSCPLTYSGQWILVFSCFRGTELEDKGSAGNSKVGAWRRLPRESSVTTSCSFIFSPEERLVCVRIGIGCSKHIYSTDTHILPVSQGSWRTHCSAQCENGIPPPNFSGICELKLEWIFCSLQEKQSPPRHRGFRPITFSHKKECKEKAK